MPLQRYAAFLRGVTPMNAQMPQLRAALEAAEFDGVRTLLSSGNVVFGARKMPLAALERKVEAAMSKVMGRSFMTIVRPLDALRILLEDDPYDGFEVPAHAKRVVTFFRTAPPRATLPVELHQARILCVRGAEAFSAYLPDPHGPVFMTLIERTFGKEGTTRTWDTVKRVAADPGSGAGSAG